MKLGRFVPLAAVEVATALSGIGNGITAVVIPWLILERTGSATAAGTVAALTAVPMVVASVVSGTLVDRVGRRRTSVVSDVLSLMAVALIPLVDLFGGLTLTWIALLGVLGATFDPAGVTARETMLPEAARRAGLRLERVNGFHEAVWGMSYVIGPGVAGLLIALVGPTSTLWATAVAFALSALVIAVVPIPGGGRPDRSAVDTSFWRETVTGLRFVRRDAVLLSVGILDALLAATYLPIEGVLLPVYFTNEGSPERLGLLILTIGLGWVAGSLLYGAVGTRLPRRATFLVGAIGTAVALIPMAFLPPYPVMLVSGALSGLLYGPINPLLNLAMQHRTPSHLRGRVVGLLTSIATAAAPIGYLITGPLVDGFGLQTAFFFIIGVLLVAGVAVVFVRPLHELDKIQGQPHLVHDHHGLL